MKCRFEGANPYREKVIKALYSIGAGEQADTARRHYERERARIERQQKQRERELAAHRAKEAEQREKEERIRAKRLQEVSVDAVPCAVSCDYVAYSFACRAAAILFVGPRGPKKEAPTK